MKIAISLDSACDLSQEIIRDYEFKIIPFGVSLGDEFFYDGEKDTETIFNLADEKNVLPKTSAINVDAFKNHFQNILESFDAIIHISLSKKLSSAYDNSVNASKSFKNVYCIDSKSLSTGISLLAIYGKKLIDENLPIKSIVEKIEERVPFVQASFILERLDYMHKGGRCSSIALLGANILKIRPQIELSNGAMISTIKYRGKMSDCVRKYCKNIFENNQKIDKSVIFITHSNASLEMIDACREEIKSQGFEKNYETVAGATISSHCGKNSIGILFLKN